jgi:hypothetical protein
MSRALRSQRGGKTTLLRFSRPATTDERHGMHWRRQASRRCWRELSSVSSASEHALFALTARENIEFTAACTVSSRRVTRRFVRSNGCASRTARTRPCDR